MGSGIAEVDGSWMLWKRIKEGIKQMEHIVTERGGTCESAKGGEMRIRLEGCF